MSSSWKFYVSYGLFDKDLCDVIAKWIADGRAKNKRSDTEVWGEYGGERLFAVDGGYVATVQVLFMERYPYDLFGARYLNKEYEPYSNAPYGKCEGAFDDTQLHRPKYIRTAIESFFADISETERKRLEEKADVAYLRGETRCRSFVGDGIPDKEYRQKEECEEFCISGDVLEGWCPIPFKNDVVIPEHIRTIGQDAFSNTVDRVFHMNEYDLQTGKATGEWIHPVCLRNITFPQGLTSIGKKAFAKVMTLREVNFPDGLQTIDDMAFRDCLGLRQVIIPDSLTRLGAATFQGCKNLESVTLPANLRVIPKNAFRDCRKLGHVIVPDSVQKIEEGAFQGCELLTVTYLGQQPKCGRDAFKGCASLLDATTADSIYEAVWKEVSADGKLAISLKHLTSDWELRECEKKYIARAFKEIVAAAIEQNLPEVLLVVLAMKGKVPLDLIDGWIAESENVPDVRAFLKDYKSSHYTEKESAKVKKQAEEKKAGVRALTVADWKKIFKWETKDGRITITGLKTSDPNVEIPARIGKAEVTGIGSCAFWNCQTLESVVISDGVEWISGSFGGCGNLKSVVIPASVRWIGIGAFERCTALTSVALPEGITEIGNSAFEGCTNLSSVSFPSSLQTVGVNALANTAWIRKQPPLVIINDVVYRYQGGESVLEIPKGVTKINPSAFSGCESLTGVIIPEGVTEIGESAFEGCTNLASVTVPESVQKIGASAFENTAWLRMQPPFVIVNDILCLYQGGDATAVVPEGVKTISPYAFSRKDTLTKIVFPKTVTKMDVASVYGCDNLRLVIIPESVTEMSGGVLWLLQRGYPRKSRQYS